jgi:DNA-binding transcriptional regulator YhcF (GntR family)/DNA-binding LacI/PurR family transcriptional regulator
MLNIFYVYMMRKKYNGVEADFRMLETLKINRKGRDSVSTQIVEYVRSQIQNRNLEPGQRLPTTTEFIKKIRVGNHTVRDALWQLEQEGFIEVTPGKGTFVAKRAFSLQNGNGGKGQRIARLALSSAFADKTRPDTRKNDSFRINSVQGFLDECAHLNVSGVILPEDKVRSESASDLYEHLLESNCEGLVWLYPDSKDWAKVRYLHGQGFPVVVTRRSHIDDHHIASVESDEFRAGIMAGRRMIDAGCKNLVVFSYYEEKIRDEIDQTNFPVGFQEGLKTFLERQNSSGVNHGVESLYIPRDHNSKFDFIRENLKRINSEAGVIFTSGLDFFHYVLNASPEDMKQLKKSELAVSCTRYWALKYAPLVKEINFTVLIQPFDDVVQCAVQKLMSILDGKMENTSTFVNVEIADFWEFWRKEVSPAVNDLTGVNMSDGNRSG